MNTEFLQQSSIGRCLAYMTHYGLIGWPTSPATDIRQIGEFIPPTSRYCGWSLHTASDRVVRVPFSLVYLAASECSLFEAYRGECAGVDPLEFARWHGEQVKPLPSYQYPIGPVPSYDGIEVTP